MNRTRAVALAAVIGLAVAACGGSSSSTTAAPTTTAATTTTAGATTTTAAATTTTAAATTTTAAAATTTAGGGDAAMLAEGEDLFQNTAGGVGCAYCHGPDALGRDDTGAPDIRGKTFDDIVNQLASNQNMSFIQLTTDQIKAIAAYLATLAP